MKNPGCPFCGDKKLIINDNEDGCLEFNPEFFWVQCGNPDCQTEGPIGKNKKIAYQKWVRRFTG